MIILGAAKGGTIALPVETTYLEGMMQDIDYSHYYWQDEEVRLRAIQAEDWESCYISGFDTPARRLLECAVELPPTISGAKKFVEENADFSSTNGRIMVTIDNLNGESIGGINENPIKICFLRTKA